MIDYEKELNPQQLEAVMGTEGPLLVIAGAGSGKTRTIVYRVARLIELGTRPEQVLLLTFTRKSAMEMLKRASELSDDRCHRVSGGTFHSIAHGILRRYAHLLGFENTFTVLDRVDMEDIIRAISKEKGFSSFGTRLPRKRTIAEIISKSANKRRTVSDVVRDEYPQFLEQAEIIEHLSSQYVQYKKENNLMDYDDLMIQLRRLLSGNPDVRRLLSARYRYILVDEYQDTNTIQADILKCFGEENRNIMVVGDDSQAIYAFRGANYKNMFEFPELFPDTKIIKLEENYRSTQPILTFTNAIMEGATKGYTKCLFSRKKDGMKPRVINTDKEPIQAMAVCRKILELFDRGMSLKDMAVLFRASYHSFELEKELTRYGIPYVKYGGFKFMELAHIKDIISHLRVVINPRDQFSWIRILNLVQNIGPIKARSIFEWLQKERRKPAHIIEWSGRGKHEGGLKRLSSLLRKIQPPDISPEEAIERCISYYKPIMEDKFDDYPKREKDLEQLKLMASRYRALKHFIDDIVLEPPTSPSDIVPGDNMDVLTLSTVHSAKGLEWRVVFIIWAVDGYFPSSRAFRDDEALEEERRLMYVASTRAKDMLFIYYPGGEGSRRAFEDGYYHTNGLCSFIKGISPEIVDYIDYGRPKSSANQDSVWLEDSQHTESISDELSPGDRVRHPAFGSGVVSRIYDNDKVEVFFRDVGPKLLHLKYTTLERY